MIFGAIIEWAVGLLCIILGLLIWRRQMVSILHSYHYQNVKKENMRAYTKQIGIGLILIGAGIGITGLLNLFYSPVWWIPVLAGFVLGLIVMYRAQKKYNGSVF